MVKLEEVFSESEEELDSEGEEGDEEVLLGFVEEAPSSEPLERHFFPSKVGGVPAWLDPVNLPRGGKTVCGFCGKPLAFLMQVYGPLESEPAAFHRTLLLFICKSNTCLKRHFRQQEEPDRKHSIRAFRCQLPRSNPFYSFQPAKPGTLPPAGPTTPLCDWCGAWVANKLCGGCRDHAYCSKEHQVEHWKGGHSATCKRLDKSTPSARSGSDSEAKPSELVSKERKDLKETAGSFEGPSKDETKGVKTVTGTGSGKENDDESLGAETKVGVKLSREGDFFNHIEASTGRGDVTEARRNRQGEGTVPELPVEIENGALEFSETEEVPRRAQGLSLDEAGFPVSPVDWENGNEASIESGSTEQGVKAGDERGLSSSKESVSGEEVESHSSKGAVGHDDVSSSGQGGDERRERTDKRRVNGEVRGLTRVVKPRALDPKLWPELEIVVESEADYSGEPGVSGGVNGGLGDVSALMEQYGRRVEKKREFSEEDLEEAEAGMRDLAGDKKQWAAFEARLGRAPEQVMRYCRSADAKPLWPSTSHRPSKESIPPCPDCGSERIFEFQVLPQLLYYMHVDSSDLETLDWGTIAVYTCSKSCSGGKEAYREEAVWLQLPQ